MQGLPIIGIYGTHTMRRALHGSRTLLMQTDDGQIIEPYSISAGLDYPGIGPMHAHLIETGRSKVYSATDREALEAAMHLSKEEGIIPALESAHAFAVLKDIDFKTSDIVVINLSGRGDKDLQAYMDYMDGKIGEHEAIPPIEKAEYLESESKYLKK